MNNVINVSKGYIPNLGSLGPLLHVEKFVDGGWVVVGGLDRFSVKLESGPLFNVKDETPSCKIFTLK